MSGYYHKIHNFSHCRKYYQLKIFKSLKKRVHFSHIRNVKTKADAPSPKEKVRIPRRYLLSMLSTQKML